MANKMNIPFSPPDITQEEIDEVAEALRSGWITTGPRVKELERQLAEYLGVKRCVCLNSQTACAEMALRVLGRGAGRRSDRAGIYIYGKRFGYLPRGCHAGYGRLCPRFARDGL